MTKPTEAQIQRACDLASEAAGTHNAWAPKDYRHHGAFTALADTIAQLDAMQAERDKARADLAEIYIQLDGVSGLHRLADDSRQAIEAAHDLASQAPICTLTSSPLDRSIRPVTVRSTASERCGTTHTEPQ